MDAWEMVVNLQFQAVSSGLADLAFTIWDEGGIDTTRIRTDTTNQVVTLVANGRSVVMGGIGKMTIARDTVIKNF